MRCFYNMEFTLELFTILLNILSVIVIPVLMIFYNKLNKIEQLYVSLRDDVNRIYEVSNQNDKELLTH
jgi:Cu/Ag efflux pump CusA